MSSTLLNSLQRLSDECAGSVAQAASHLVGILSRTRLDRSTHLDDGKTPHPTVPRTAQPSRGLHQIMMRRIRVLALQAQVKIPAPSGTWSGKPCGDDLVPPH